MKKNTILLCLLFILFLSSCVNKGENMVVNYVTSAGNIQNGGYIIKYDDNYIYANADDYNNLYKINIHSKDKEKLAGGHDFYEMNLYNDEIYYISSVPGEIWKVSVDGSSKEKLINQRVQNLILYDNKMYYRLSEDNDWGKLYSADLNGENKKLLAQKIKGFCIYNGIIYYSDLDKNALCSMNTDGTNITVINDSYTNNLFVENTMLIYSDHNREDKLYAYDLNNNTEKCISEDRCWDLNCNNEWIFYRNQSEGGSLYCVSFDGNTKYKLIDGNVTDIVVIDELICYRNINKDNKIEYFYLEDKLNLS